MSMLEMLGKKKYKKEIDDVLASRAELVKALKEQARALIQTYDLFRFTVDSVIDHIPPLLMTPWLQYQKQAVLEAGKTDIEATDTLTREQLISKVDVQYEECRRLRAYLERLFGEIKKQEHSVAEAIMKG